MPRNLICPHTGDPCDNGNCKIGSCMIDNAEKEQARSEYLEREAEREAEELAMREFIAVDILNRSGQTPTTDRVREVARQPDLVDLVREIFRNARNCR